MQTDRHGNHKLQNSLKTPIRLRAARINYQMALRGRRRRLLIDFSCSKFKIKCARYLRVASVDLMINGVTVLTGDLLILIFSLRAETTVFKARWPPLLTC